MLAYSKTYEEFCDDINKGQIVSAIVTALNRDFSDSEKRAFRNSLSSVKNALTRRAYISMSWMMNLENLSETELLY